MRYLLLYNPVSGKGKFHKKIDFIKKEFEDRNLHLDVYPSKKANDLNEKAYLEAGNYDYLIVSGGDGSINEVINGIMRSEYRPKFAIMPSGTANDSAAILGINKNVRRTLKLIFQDNPVKIDINKINDKYFFYTTAAGVLTKISYDISRRKLKKYGYIAYLTEGAKDLINKYNMKMTIKHDGGTLVNEYILVLGLSAKRVGGMYLTGFTNAKMNDGLLELRLIPYNKKFRTARVLGFFINRGRKNKNHDALVSSRFEISTTNNVVWNVDGERGAKGSVVITVLKEELDVIASKRAIKQYF